MRGLRSLLVRWSLLVCCMSALSSELALAEAISEKTKVAAFDMIAAATVGTVTGAATAAVGFYTMNPVAMGMAWATETNLRNGLLKNAAEEGVFIGWWASWTSWFIIYRQVLARQAH